MTGCWLGTCARHVGMSPSIRRYASIALSKSAGSPDARDRNGALDRHPQPQLFWGAPHAFESQGSQQGYRGANRATGEHRRSTMHIWLETMVRHQGSSSSARLQGSVQTEACVQPWLTTLGRFTLAGNSR